MDFLSNRGRTRTSEEERPRSSYSNNQISNNLISRIFSRWTSEDNELSQVIEVDKDLQIFKHNQLKLLDPKILYNTKYFSKYNLLYRYYREEQISAIGENIVQLNLVNQESLKDIKNTKMTMMHMELIVSEIKGLTRKYLGTKVLIVL